MREPRRHTDVPGRPGGRSALDAELRDSLFGSLPRSGQRANAHRYVLGLLSVQGRKTLRSIAAQFDGAAPRQNVHHFISTSPWDWVPVRHALARYTCRKLEPDAWAILPLLIPKAGDHSVGVDEQPAPAGQAFRGQRAVGAWLASGRSAVPVHWQLRLSDRWMADPLRQRANIPREAAAGTTEECVRLVVTELLGSSGTPRGPVVVDMDDVDAVSVARFLSLAGVPFLVRAGSDVRLRLDRFKLPRYGGWERTVRELTDSLPRLRQRVDPGDGPALASAIPVAVSPARSDRMLLLGEWDPAGHQCHRVWLTNVTTVAALRLARLPGVVARDFAAVAEDVGVRDFAGRSFPGWHRHITLASVAHLVAILETRGTAAERNDGVT
ncbi:transposase [Streptomyces verrucosisporus]|uniref:IS701 family transposase n=1 Tax=Streptomyces verrucosisporus TaxID=1695161 RepID=UPI0019CF5877|nr:transposase [Streptomyces verrucosisporus]MBN3932081.1 transposase [Streptomyces verrucosisporus]